MRSRGSVQRIHIITNTPPQHFTTKTRPLIKFPSTGPRYLGSLNSMLSRPVCQPPRNRAAAMPLTANMAPYSAMKKSSQRKPEYSVWKPATSSDSASARSNGARLQLDVPQMKKTQKAMNVNGSWNRYHLWMNPVCCLMISVRFSEPATMTGTMTQMARGTS